jgi:hypothetical protein
MKCDGLAIISQVGDSSLASGKLDPKVIRKTHPRPILAFSRAVDLG